jgi:Domain of unknown function (DUF222)
MITSCLENLRGGLNGLDDDEVVHMLRQIEQFSRSTHSVMLDVVAEAEARGIAARTGFGTTARMLSAMLRVSVAEARTRTEHARMVGARRNITGQTLPPRLRLLDALGPDGLEPAGDSIPATPRLGRIMASPPP